MIDVVLDLALDDWLAQERARAQRAAARQIECAEHMVALVRSAYDHGDKAHASGDERSADKLWRVAAMLDPTRPPLELVDGVAEPEWS